MSLLVLLNFKHFVASGSGSGGAGDGEFSPEAYRKSVESRSFQPQEKTRLELIKEISQETPEKPQVPEKTKKKRQRYVEPQIEFRRRPRRARPAPVSDSGNQDKAPQFVSYAIPEPSARDIERARQEQERQLFMAMEDRRRELEEKQAQAEWVALEAKRAAEHHQKLVRDDEELVMLIAALIAKKRVR